MTSRKLLRLNIIGSAVAILALVSYTLLYLYPDWSIYRQIVSPEYTLSAGGTQTILGQQWQLDSAHSYPNVKPYDSPEAPSGSKVVLVVIQRTGGPPPEDASCTSFVTDGRQHWSTSSDQNRARLSYQNQDATYRCNRPGRLEQAFIVPADAKITATEIYVVTTAKLPYPESFGKFMLKILL